MPGININRRCIYSGGGAETPLLDLYPNAQAAYSLRKLRSDYSGYCIKIRRSSDDTTLDIGFYGNEINYSAVLSFVGLGDGFVHTWYDQSGNGLNVAKGANFSHPKIVSSGAFITNNGKKSLYFNDANRNLSGSAAADWKFMHVSEHSIYMVAQAGIVANPGVNYGLLGTNNGTTANNGFYLAYQDSGGGDDRLQHLVSNASGSPATSPVNNTASNNIITANTLHVISILCDPTDATGAQRSKISIDMSPYINLNANTNAINNVNPAFPIQVGGYGDSAVCLIGYVSELIIYPTEQSTNNDAAIQNNMLAFFGIAAYP